MRGVHGATPEYRAVLGLLPHALPSETPLAGGLAALLAEARRRRRASDGVGGLAASGRSGGGGPRAGPRAWAAAFVRRAPRVEPALHGRSPAGHPGPVEQLARLPDGRIVALIGTGTPSASARLFVAEDGRRGELAIAGLPALPPGASISSGSRGPAESPISGGVFRWTVGARRSRRRDAGRSRAGAGRCRDRGARTRQPGAYGPAPPGSPDLTFRGGPQISGACDGPATSSAMQGQRRTGRPGHSRPCPDLPPWSGYPPDDRGR